MSQSTPTAVALRKAPTGSSRPRRDHEWRLSGRASHAGVRRAWIGKDTPWDHLPGQRRPAVRRARRVDELRGERGGARPGRRVARLRSARALIADRKLVVIDYVHVDRSEIEETGEYDLEGLFVRLEHAVNSIGARRVVLDTIESLFGGLDNEAILRAELRRLFRWLRERDLTVVITGERGETTLTRHGLEEYVTDAVIQLDHRVHRPDLDPPAPGRQVSRLASRHQRVSIPDRRGWRRRAARDLAHARARGVVRARVEWSWPSSTPCSAAQGFYRGSTVLVSGTAGTGKTTLAAHFVDAACRRGERCLHFLFEESPQQMLRNMRSCGLDLGRWVDDGLAAVSRRSSVALRARDPSRDDAPRRRALAAHGRRRRSDDQSADGRHADRRARDAHAHDRLPEDAGHHGALHQPDVWRHASWRRPRR